MAIKLPDQKMIERERLAMRSIPFSSQVAGNFLRQSNVQQQPQQPSSKLFLSSFLLNGEKPKLEPLDLLNFTTPFESEVKNTSIKFSPSTDYSLGKLLLEDVPAVANAILSIPYDREAREQFRTGFNTGLLALSESVKRAFVAIDERLIIKLSESQKQSSKKINQQILFSADKDAEMIKTMYEYGGLKLDDTKTFRKKIQDPKFVAQGLGMNLPNFLAALGASVPVAVAGAPTAAVAGTGFLTTAFLEGGAFLSEAEQYNVTPKQAQNLSLLVGAVNGILEMLPIMKLLNRNPAAKNVKSRILGLVTRNILSQSAAEGSTESLQTIVSNAAAKVFDEERELLSNVGESAFFGSLMGGGVSLVTDAPKMRLRGLEIEDVSGQDDLASSISKAKASGQSFDEWVKGQGYNDGKQIAKEAKQLGSDQGGLSDFTLNKIKNEDYVSQEISIKDLRKADPDLDDYLKTSKVREYEGEPFGMSPIVGSNGEVLDGYNRIAQATENGEDTVTVLKGKTRSQLKAEWDRVKIEPKKTLQNVISPAKAKPKFPDIKYTELDEIAKKLRRQDLTRQQREETRNLIRIMEETLAEHPAKSLIKYVSRTTGQLPEVTGKATMDSLTGSGKKVATSKFGRKGDQIIQEILGRWDDTYSNAPSIEKAQELVDSYIKIREQLKNLKEQNSGIHKEISAVLKGEKLMQLAKGDRRAVWSGLKQVYGLSDSELSKLRGGRDIMAMDRREWEQFVNQAEVLAQEVAEKREAKIKLLYTVQSRELQNWENVQAAMKLPSLKDMSVEQMNQLNEALLPYQQADQFLTVRQLETVDRTDLAGLKTLREVREFLAKKSGTPIEELQIIKSTEFDRMTYDTALARKNPLYDLMVERKNVALLQSEEKVLRYKEKINELLKDARSSRPTKGIWAKLKQFIAPTDEVIVHWLESTPEERIELGRKMTEEELRAAEYQDNVYKDYYRYLVQRAAEQKFSSRFENQYYPHVRRSFLEAWGDDGLVRAFRESFDQYRQNERYLNILDQKTSEIVPYEKWLGFVQYRTDQLQPTKNAAKAFLAYTSALEKAKQLDSFIPELMMYVSAVSPKNLTPRGLEIDDSLNRFVKEWINSKKGRIAPSFVKPGGKPDWALRLLISFTRIKDLGFSVPVGIANQFGEQYANFVYLKPRNYIIGWQRLATRQGHRISKKYDAFVGETFWEKLNDASNTAGDKFLQTMFGLFSAASRRGNQIFLLGSMTKQEFDTETISVKRLAELQKAMGQYRVVENSESIMGKTAEGQVLGQYKRWAWPILFQTSHNIKTLTGMIRKDGFKTAVKSKEFQELTLSVGLATAIGFMFFGYYEELEKKKDRSFVEEIIFKSMRDSLSMIGALDPKLILSEPRLMSFLADIGEAISNLILLERYKTTKKLIGIEQFKRNLTPNVVRQVFQRSEDTTNGRKTLDEMINARTSSSVGSKRDFNVNGVNVSF